MNPLRPLVATQLPSEGSVVPDDPITRHIVLKVFRGPAPPVRPLIPPRGDSRRTNGPIRGAGRDRRAGRGTTRSSVSLISNNRDEGAVRHRENTRPSWYLKAEEPREALVSVADQETLPHLCYGLKCATCLTTSRHLRSGPAELRSAPTGECVLKFDRTFQCLLPQPPCIVYSPSPTQSPLCSFLFVEDRKGYHRGVLHDPRCLG
ncbi:unnamed protein product [Boreogadus saida]